MKENIYCVYCKKEGVKKLAKIKSRKICDMHNTRLKRNGDPFITKNKRHSKRHTTEYIIWNNIKNRCLNTNNCNYKYYGERGIKIYKNWAEDFNCFYEYLIKTIGLRPSKDKTLDRIDNNKNYEPGNIRWADKTTQARNRRCHAKNISSVKGIIWNKSNKNWRVRITVDSKEINIGSFKDLKEAVDARKKAEKKYWK